jgi:hypothetical protein
MAGFTKDLPTHFNDATHPIIKHIDVLWLDDNAIAAAFEVERTTSIYSGLLRMSDLLVMQPNLDIPIFLVAPESRRDKVLEEVNRPTVKALPKRSLHRTCRYIYFESLKEHGRVLRRARFHERQLASRHRVGRWTSPRPPAPRGRNVRTRPASGFGAPPPGKS